MRTAAVALLSAFLVVTRLYMGLASQSTGPAFLWSPHEDGLVSGMKEAVNYRVLSPKDLVKSVMLEGGWSNLLCAGKEAQNPVDLAILFVGKELKSLDIPRPRKADTALVDLLKVSFANANSSVAFPYVAASEEMESIEASFVSEFAHSCGNNLKVRNLAFLDSCSVEGEHLEKLTDIQSVHDYVVSKMNERSDSQTNVIVICSGGSKSIVETDERQSESQILSELINHVEELKAKYTVLYVSDPLREIQYPSHRELERFLAEGGFGNGTVNSTTCDGVCQIKSTLLEGIFVGIVLLIILISGLCCMAGIDTPARFETPHDS